MRKLISARKEEEEEEEEEVMIMEEMREIRIRSEELQELKAEEEEVELPGFRFHPTDEELVAFYLRRKVDRKRFSIEIIKEIDIYKHDPWDLPKGVSAGEKEWYFFCLRGRKYRNSIRPNRVTGSGFWKATGIDRPVFSSADTAGECIGLKKSLVYYRGSAGKGTKTDWMMHEFRLPRCSGNFNNTTTTPSLQEAEVWTICRIFKRTVSSRKINWKAAAAAATAAAANKSETPADSGSKSSSFDSDCGNDYKLLVSPSNYSASQWNPMAAQQDPMTAAMAYQCPNKLEPFNHNNVGDLLKLDSNWDELGRIVEFMTDKNVASSYCKY